MLLMNRACLGSVAAVFLAMLIGADCAAQGSVAKPEPVLVTIAATASRDVRMQCRPYGLQEFEDQGLIVGCIGDSSDTVVVLYRTRKGVPLAITREVYVPRERLATVADSVRAQLSQEFGTARACPETIWTGPDLHVYQWHAPGLTVRLAVNERQDDSGERVYPQVAVQYAAADLPCDDWIRKPLHR